MAYSVTVLTWGLLRYNDAYVAAGEYKNMLACIKWPLDYFMKAHTSKYEFYAQVRGHFVTPGMYSETIYGQTSRM